MLARHHALLTSHHLIAPSKRKDLSSLSHDLKLVGFAKIGHPGIMYVEGEPEDVDEWLKEVKTWQWLALRVRVGSEPLDAPRNDKGPARRGSWKEVEKIGEALEWLRDRGRESLLLDIGMGSGASR